LSKNAGSGSGSVKNQSGSTTLVGNEKGTKKKPFDSATYIYGLNMEITGTGNTM
jgi:hypothetical protein